MNTERLRYFLSIADEGSISRAAIVLGIAQPALSRQVRLLEDSLGVTLFRRTRQGMQLTEEGEQLRASLSGPLRQVELALQNVGSPLAQIERDVVFGMPETAACVLGAPLVSSLTSAFPRVSLRVVVRDSHHLVDDMLRGDVDLALIQGPPSDERLFYTDLVSEDLVLVGGPMSRLTVEQPVAFRKLAKLPFVLPGLQPGLRDFIENTALRLEIDIDFRFEVDSLQISKDLIEAGLAYGILPVSAFVGELRAGRLAYTPIFDPVITRHFGITARPGLVLPRSFVNRFGLLVGAEVTRLIESGVWPATLAPSWRST